MLKPPEVRKRKWAYGRGSAQSQCPVLPIVRGELVAPIQPEAGEQPHQSFGRAIAIAAKRHNANFFLIPVLAALYIEATVFVPEGTTGFSVDGKLESNL